MEQFTDYYKTSYGQFRRHLKTRLFRASISQSIVTLDYCCALYKYSYLLTYLHIIRQWAARPNSDRCKRKIPSYTTHYDLDHSLWRIESGKFLPYAGLISLSFYRLMLCIRGTSHGRVSVCPSVCLSVTSRCSTNTAKRRITQTTPHDSPGTLVFWRQRSPRNSTGVIPYGGAKCRSGGSKSATFDI